MAILPAHATSEETQLSQLSEGHARDADFSKDRRETMKKRIVVCCDGTWNEPETIKDERKVSTNVLKTVRSVVPRDEESGVEQVVFYDQGVGTGALGVL